MRDAVIVSTVRTPIGRAYRGAHFPSTGSPSPSKQHYALYQHKWWHLGIGAPALAAICLHLGLERDQSLRSSQRFVLEV